MRVTGRGCKWRSRAKALKADASRHEIRTTKQPATAVAEQVDITPAPAGLQLEPTMSCRDAIMLASLAQDYVLILATFGKECFVNEVNNLVEKKIELSPATKARILAALWANHCIKEFDLLMFSVIGFFGESELFKLVPLIDRPRRIKQLKRRLERIKDRAKEGKTKLVIREIAELEKEPHSGSLTSSFAKRVAKFVGTISADVLTFQALNYPTDNWKMVADACHLKPSHFAADWFLPFCFGVPAPDGTLVNIMSSLTTETLPRMLRDFPYLAECYSMIRQRVQERTLVLSQEAKAELAARSPIQDVIWFYEDIVQNCPEAEERLFERLRNNEFSAALKDRINYPKLMERIMYMGRCKSKSANLLIASASEMLKSVTFPQNNLRVSVIGDCSSSMSVAVNTASIMASIFTARLKAQLSFFNGDVVMPPVQPKQTDEVLAVAKAIRATGCTSPAACLYPYYKAKKIVDLFIIVTDEEENTQCNGYLFAPLFRKYLNEVNPNAKLFFVSFLRVGDEGQMIRDLKKDDIVAKQFRFDPSRPDLTKFDELIGLLTLQILDGMGDTTPANSTDPSTSVLTYAQAAATAMAKQNVDDVVSLATSAEPESLSPDTFLSSVISNVSLKTSSEDDGTGSDDGWIPVGNNV
ncbi:hypothetical protein HDU84_009815 [Entophlyctis sp. JEL0112]|nr:hypothetical protein HDU84_009815 [Entophlyctis sp. JEL0112]